MAGTHLFVAFYVRMHLFFSIRYEQFSTCSSYLQSFFRPPSFSSPPSCFLWRCSPGQRSVQLWAPAQKRKKKKKSPDTFTHFLRLFAFHMDGQLHFTGIILDGNILIIPVNCQRSTLSSIISVSFEFLLAASMHKFLKRYENNTDFFFRRLPDEQWNMEEIREKRIFEIALFVWIYLSEKHMFSVIF